MAGVAKEYVSKSSNGSCSFSYDDDEVESEDEPLVPPPSCWFEGGDSRRDVDTNESAVRRQPANPLETAGYSSHQDNPEKMMHISGNPSHFDPPHVVGRTHPSPSWREISSQVLPAAARELLSSSWRRIYHSARLSYSRGHWYRKFSDIGNNAGGIHFSPSSNLPIPESLSGQLPSFTSLSWVDRQLVKEWRTYLPQDEGDNEDYDFERARALVPKPAPRPKWQRADMCHACHKSFGPTRLRHHCRLCGCSFCQAHSSSTSRLPHLGYDPDVPERVCDSCKQTLTEQELAERVAWRLARCRDFMDYSLTPYFAMGLDSASDMAVRVTKVAIAMAKSIPLGAQATVAVETVDVLRKYGLHGIYGIMLRQEFLAAADLLRRALGINETAWPLSVHELSAAIFYALAQHRAMRGLNPEHEETIHTLRSPADRNGEDAPVAPWTDTAFQHPPRTAPPAVRNTIPTLTDSYDMAALSFHENPVIDPTDTYNPVADTMEQTAEATDKPVHTSEEASHPNGNSAFSPVCDPVPDALLSALIFYAPIAMTFIYAKKEVDMQLLAAQQGWILLYSYLEQDYNPETLTDRPASAIFLHREHKIVCLSIRGTATINDVVTDIRQIPVPFPDTDMDSSSEKEEDWTNLFRGQGLAMSGMAAAAFNLYTEHIEALLFFARQGYRVRITGHSLGGGVGTMVGVLVRRHFESCPDLASRVQSNDAFREESALLHVYSYGTPSCVDSQLADSVNSFVTSIIHHDDVFPRLTATSCRGLLKHLLHIRETWVKTHIEEDLRAVGERARTAWAPKFRQNFTLTSSHSLRRYCSKQVQKGKEKLMSVKDKLSGEEADFGGTSTSRTRQGRREITEELLSESELQEVTAKKSEGGPKLLLEFLGGVDTQMEGIVIDGDEFFDTDEKLVESDGEETVATENFRDPLNVPPSSPVAISDSWSSMEPERVVSNETVPADESLGVENGPAPVVLEETPLPRMFVPGRVIHVYAHRGVYKAAFVPRTLRELRRISLAGNMLSNHTTRSYYEGLLEVQTARLAPEKPPKWTAFDEDDTCCCCANRFTWASTSDSEAQEARDKHNCRSCGGLVCDPCAKNRLPIPSIGLTVPVRICDRCYNDMGGGLSVASSSSSFLAVEEEDGHARDDAPSPGRTTRDAAVAPREESTKAEDRPERRREKRSMVVDDLASRIRSSALTTCL